MGSGSVENTWAAWNAVEPATTSATTRSETVSRSTVVPSRIVGAGVGCGVGEPVADLAEAVAGIEEGAPCAAVTHHDLAQRDRAGEREPTRRRASSPLRSSGATAQIFRT